jgi:DNA-binding Lrp family transcriptional regulator
MLFWWCLMAAEQPYGSTPVSVTFDKRLSREARFFYGAIWWWDFSNQQPTQVQMAEDIGCSPANVWRCIRELEQAGLVEQRRGGYGKPNAVRPVAGPVPKNRREEAPPREEPGSSHGGDRVLPERTRVVTTPRERTANDESARAVERAGSKEDDITQHLLDYLRDQGGVYKHHSDMMVHRDAPDRYEALAEDGLVEARQEQFGRYFTLTKESAPC